MSRKYRRDGTPYPEGDEGLFAMARDFDKRIVRQDRLPNGYFVSTVWLGIDHSWGEGPPLIFETMVFLDDSGAEDYQERYATEDEAILGHMRAVDLYKERA